MQDNSFLAHCDPKRPPRPPLPHALEPWTCSLCAWRGSDSWEQLLCLCGPQGRFQNRLPSPTTKMIKPSSLGSYGIFLCQLLQLLAYVLLVLAAFLFWITYRTSEIPLSGVGYMLGSISSVNFHLKLVCVCICVCKLENIPILLGDRLHELTAKTLSAAISWHCLRDGLSGFSGY